MTVAAPFPRSHTLVRGALALLIAFGALVAVLTAAPRAEAFSNPMLLGFDDDPAFEWDDAATRNLYLTRAGQEGGSVVRLEVYWREVAPPDPAPGFRPTDPGDPQYDFSIIDGAVQTATAHHQRILLLVRSAPVWAERSDVPANFNYNGAWWPNAAKFGQFARAVAARYSGHFRTGGHTLPAVRYYQAWNEPNLPYYLSPQWGKVNGKVVPLAPSIYRDLLNAFYAGVKSVSRSNVVVSAGTAPYGDAPASGQQRMHPVTFLESLFCLDSHLRKLKCANPPHLDVMDHHPYSLSPAHSANNPLDISVVDIGRVTRVVNAAVRAGTVVPRTRKPVWVTEVAWSDVKPYSLPTQARALSEAFYLLWRQGVAVTLWFALRDLPNQMNSFKGSGLYTVSGTAKPVAAAFRFPFCTFPGSGGISSVWGKAPGRGRVSVQLLSGKRWRTILTVSPGAGGYFLTSRRLAAHQQLRAVQGRAVSLAWSTTGGL
jgi:hypothetical protein